LDSIFLIFRDLDQTQMSPSPRAVIDCGTNTFHLAIADESGIPVFSQRIPVRVGEGGFRTGRIRSERLARALDAVNVLWETCRNYGVDDIDIVATSAIRDASNRREFTDTVATRTGHVVTVLSGPEEAALIQAGVAPTCPDLPGPWLTMDIGGGSVEFILWNLGDSPEQRFSVDAGVGRLQDFGHPPDPLGTAGASKFDGFLDSTLRSVHEALAAHPPGHLVGSAGSFETFAACLGTPFGDRATASVALDRTAFDDLATRLIEGDLAARLAIPGMAPDRAPFIGLSAMLVRHTLNWLPAGARLWASPAALREGVLRVGREMGLATYLQSLKT
jgi:exopolyphosphatase/guanosine-5'-triphosphate,3'-diphosphate pyrophosphatase